MLDAMRRGALNWFAKGLLALLVVAFAVWGIGDGIRRIGSSTVAKLGSTEISVEEFRQAYNEELNAITRRSGRRLTPLEASRMRLEHRALSRLLSREAPRLLHLHVFPQVVEPDVGGVDAALAVDRDP